MEKLADHGFFGDECSLGLSLAVGHQAIGGLVTDFDDGGHADLVDPLLSGGLLVDVSLLSTFAITNLTIGASNSVASIQTDVDDAFEQDEVGFGKLEGLELGSKQITISSEKVFEQNRVHGARGLGLLLIVTMHFLHDVNHPGPAIKAPLKKGSLPLWVAPAGTPAVRVCTCVRC